MNITKILRHKIVDNRGDFLKIMDGFEEGLNKSFGEIYFISCYNKRSRAGHYHKIATEWFTVIGGSAELTLIDIKTKLRKNIILDYNLPSTIKIEPNVAHLIQCNQSSSLQMIAYSNIKYDAQDTYPYTFD